MRNRLHGRALARRRRFRPVPGLARQKVAQEEQKLAAASGLHLKQVELLRRGASRVGGIQPRERQLEGGTAKSPTSTED